MASIDISNFLPFLFLTIALLVLSPQMAAPQNSNIYREYIGAMFKGVKFTDVPINPNVEFHFILAFAADYDDKGPTHGKFGVFWDEKNLSPTAVSHIKQSKRNVKVALALGGAKVGDNKVVFSAPSIDSWVKEAVSSLTLIINKYGLDGIDIDYENFDSTSDTETFVECIGQLIKTLKDEKTISFASIAPFDDEPMRSRYMALWERHSRIIDYVNFQFYAYDSSTTEDQFLEYYNKQLNSYRGGKVLASFSTDDADNKGLTRAHGFFDACKQLRKENKLPGIFGWCADTSSEPKYGFADETKAQNLLAGGA